MNIVIDSISVDLTEYKFYFWYECYYFEYEDAIMRSCVPEDKNRWGTARLKKIPAEAVEMNFKQMMARRKGK